MAKKKFFVALITVVFILTSYLTSSVLALSITSEEKLMEGVTYKHQETLTESGWQDIHIITADLSKPHLAFKVLSDAKGGSYLLNTYEMAKQADAVAAINADFFAAKRGQSGRGSAVGMEMSDGELKTTPSVQEKMNVLYESFDGSFLIDSFAFDIKVTAPNAKSDKIRHINKYDDRTEICMYTSKWGELSPGSVGGLIEVLVEDGKVKEKYTEHESIEISENSFVLSSHLSFNTFLLDNLNVGDEVQIEIASTPDYTKIKNAVGGGGVLVKDGVPQTEFSHNITGYNPRSAVGIDDSGKVITLVCVDGRRDGAKGMTQPELAKFMAELGCKYALNLDGGGSSLITGKTDDGIQVLNTPSDNYKRPVTNSIGIVSTEEIGQTENIKVKAEKNVFKGMKTKLSVVGYDKYYQKTENIPLENVTFEVTTSNGYVEGDKFIATAGGVATIKATYGGATSHIDINILENPTRLSFETRDIELKSGQTTKLMLKAYDKDGYSAFVLAEDVAFSNDGDCISIANGKITALKQGTAQISASSDNLVAKAIVTVDGASKQKLSEDVTIADYKNKHSELKDDQSFRFTVFGKVGAPKTLLQYIALRKTIEAVSKEGLYHSFLGNVDADLIGDIGGSSFLSKGYSVFAEKESTFITINREKANIFESDKSQWENINKAVKQAKGGNLFVFIDDIKVSSLDIEKRMLFNMLSESAKSGTNVFVFGAGVKNYCEAIDGVRYIETAGIFDNLSTKEDFEDIRDIKYVLVTVNGKDVTFEQKSILE